MFSASDVRTLACLTALVVSSCALLFGADARPPLRVCADPNNMPFSNAKGEGFENRIAALLAREMHRPLAYFWSPQRRGFIRNTLNAGRCDVVMGVPARFELLLPTRPYYRSSYVFVTRRDRNLHVISFDDERLKRLTIGVQVAGDDYDNPPAAQALASRRMIDNVRGYTLYGDYSTPDPQRTIVDAVAAEDVDVAVVWGPLAGYYARREPVAMSLRPVPPDARMPMLRFSFDIAMGVRRADTALHAELDAAIAHHLMEIHRILEAYGVPLQ